MSVFYTWVVFSCKGPISSSIACLSVTCKNVIPLTTKQKSPLFCFVGTSCTFQTFLVQMVQDISIGAFISRAGSRQEPEKGKSHTAEESTQLTRITALWLWCMAKMWVSAKVNHLKWHFLCKTATVCYTDPGNQFIKLGMAIWLVCVLHHRQPWLIYWLSSTMVNRAAGEGFMKWAKLGLQLSMI